MNCRIYALLHSTGNVRLAALFCRHRIDTARVQHRRYKHDHIILDDSHDKPRAVHLRRAQVIAIGIGTIIALMIFPRITVAVLAVMVLAQIVA